MPGQSNGRLAMCFAVLAATALAASRPNPAIVAAAPAKEAAPKRVLALFEAPPYAYELSIEKRRLPEQDKPSAPTPWRFHVRLLRAGKSLDRQSPFKEACGAARPVDVRRLLGADPESRAWSTEDDHCEIDLAARLVEIAPRTRALLITQRLGYESIYQLHWLLLPQDGELKVLWESPGGPHDFTSIRVLPGASSNRSDMIFIDSSMPSGDEATEINATRLHFDADRREIGQSPLPDKTTPLYLLRAGTFDSAEQAFGTKSDGRRCLAAFQVFRSTVLPGLAGNDYLLGVVLARREDANATITALARCPEGRKASVIELPTPR